MKTQLLNNYDAIEEKKELLRNLKNISKNSETYKVNYLIAYLGEFLSRGNYLDLKDTIQEIKKSINL